MHPFFGMLGKFLSWFVFNVIVVPIVFVVGNIYQAIERAVTAGDKPKKKKLPSPNQKTSPKTFGAKLKKFWDEI